ncbi:hypothetical protein [Bacillus suaedae]|uniref:Uncharacterized protein n=1 Tax=Halalkalibacter suaedae TaxID=2822140 RepID=A0A941ASN4_9BACI|nr:hypothetical protein [Bacillus suaedae]MBP3949544.1 hypothetical protein [Bacillus suaedae]
MYKDLRANFYFFMLDFRFATTVFWSIFIASSLVLYFMAMSFNSGSIVISPSMAVYVFCGISGFLLTKDTFPYSIKMGSTRLGFVISSISFSLVLVIFMSLIQFFITWAFNHLIELGTINNFVILSAAEATSLTSTWYNYLFVDVVINLFFLSIGFLLGTIFYRLGLLGGVTAIALFVISILIPTVRTTILEFLFQIENSKIALNYLGVVSISCFAFVIILGLLIKAPPLSKATK